MLQYVDWTATPVSMWIYGNVWDCEWKWRVGKVVVISLSIIRLVHTQKAMQALCTHLERTHTQSLWMYTDTGGVGPLKYAYLWFSQKRQHDVYRQRWVSKQRTVRGFQNRGVSVCYRVYRCQFQSRLRYVYTSVSFLTDPHVSFCLSLFLPDPHVSLFLSLFLLDARVCFSSFVVAVYTCC